ncbi:MAG: S8 family serine peptidase [Candidatus Schekmanbacteria bacterium]|nr:S8 family serine peptidase [Candidatus Schekmanbacteria bacterium]
MRLSRACLMFGLVFCLPVVSWAVGAVTAEVDQTLGLAALRQQTGLTGAGVTIGIIGEGIYDWRNYIESGDLPADIRFLDWQEGNGLNLGHVQVIHDIAPNAELLFGVYGGGPSDTITQDMVSQGANIILVMNHVEPYTNLYEDTWRSYTREVGKTSLIISPAGDYGNAHYRGTFTDSGNGEHDFGNGNTVVEIQTPPGCSTRMFLGWSETFTTPIYSDYRMRLYTSDHQLWSEVTSGSYPLASVWDTEHTETIIWYVSVWKAANAPVLPFDVRAKCDFPGPVGGLSTTIDPAYRIDKGSIVDFGALPEVLTVGALDQTTEVAPGRYAVRPYSGRGPAEITIPSTEVRPKPDIMAPDCQSVYGNNGIETGTFVDCGSSISAAVVAGIAALVQEKQGFVHTVDIKALLTGTAADLEAPGFDGVSGYGQIDPAAALVLPRVPVSAAWTVLAMLLGVSASIRANVSTVAIRS